MKTDLPSESYSFSNRRLYSDCASVLVILLGVPGLTGWALDSAPLKSVFPDLPPMVPVAAVFVLAGVLLWFPRSETAMAPTRIIAQAGGLRIASIGAVTASEYLFDWNSGLDQLLFKPTLHLDQSPIPGRPAMLTAVILYCLASRCYFWMRSPIGPDWWKGS